MRSTKQRRAARRRAESVERWATGRVDEFVIPPVKWDKVYWNPPKTSAPIRPVGFKASPIALLLLMAGLSGWPSK